MGKRGADLAERERPSLYDVVPDAPRIVGPGAAVRLGWQRLRRSLRVLLVVGAGILIAAVLFGLFVPTITLIDTIQLQNALVANGSSNNLSIQITTNDYSAQNITQNVSQALAVGHSTLRGLAPESVSYLEWDSYLQFQQVDSKPILDADPDFPMEGNPEIVPQAYDLNAALPHMKLLAGHLPSATPVDGMYEVLVYDGTGLKPGQVLNTQSLPASLYDPSTGHSTTVSQSIAFRVAGIWTERTPNDPYWNGQRFLSVPINLPPPSSQAPTIVAALMPQSSFLSALASVPSPRFYFNRGTPPPVSFDTFIVFVPTLTAININNLGERIQQIATWEQQITNTFGTNAALYGENVTLAPASAAPPTKLLTLLKSSAASGQRLALQLIGAVALVAALALLFIAAMAEALIASQRTAIVVLASRGASRAQVWGVFTAQALLLALVILIIGPFLAIHGAVLLVRHAIPLSSVGNPAVLSTNYLLSAIDLRSAVASTAVGVVLAVVVISLTALRASGEGILSLRRAAGGRGLRPPFWQRYYLDLFLALLAFIAYTQLANYGVANATQTASNGSTTAVPVVDPVRTLAPLLLVLAGALVALRLLPLAALAGAWLSARGRGAVGLLAFTQALRSGTGALALLLTLAVGISFFGFCFQATAAQNASDRAGYLVGADERVLADETTIGGAPTSALVAKYAKLPGVVAVSPVYRDELQETTSNMMIPILAIDPTTFASVAAWRSDYADQPLPTLMAQMQRASAAALATAQAKEAYPILDALVSTRTAAALHLHVGTNFTLSNHALGNYVTLTVGAIVNEWPTLDPQGIGDGFIIVDLPNYLLDASDQAITYPPIFSPDEFWLRTNPAQAGALAQALDNYHSDLGILHIFRRADVFNDLQSDPTQRGFILVLLFGGPGGAALAIIAALVYWVLLARNRAGQLAILRTLGMRSGEILRMLLGEQGLLYGFGLLVGTALGMLLTVAVLPLLQLSSPPNYASFLTLPQGLPPYEAVYPLGVLGIFYAVLLLLFVVSLLVLVAVARYRRLGQALRIGED